MTTALIIKGKRKDVRNVRGTCQVPFPRSHHDAVVERFAVAFAETGHLFHHVGELSDVEK
jgi:hypothetical protein